MTHRDGIFINLLEKENIKMGKYGSSVVLAVLAILVITVMLINYIHVREHLFSLRTVNQQLKATYARSSGTLAHLGKNQDSLNALKEKEEIIALIEQKNYSILEVLQEVESAVPPEVLLIELDIGPEKVVLKGFAPAYRPAAEMLAKLRDGSMFQEVELLSCRHNEQLHQVEFDLVLNWEGRY